jgi:hypothetical protein
MSTDTVYTAHPRHQYEMRLPPPDTQGLLSDRLASAVEAFNATTDPGERIELHREIERLRTILHPEGRKAVQRG